MNGPEDHALPGSSPEGEAFIRRLRARDHAAFAELVESQRDRIYSYLLHLTRGTHDAEDLTQTTFLKAWKAVDRLHSGSSPGAWLMTIARNSAFNHLRQKRPDPLPEDLNLADPNPPPDQQPASDDFVRLWSLARRLKPAQFEALWLRHAAGHSTKEVAAIMDSSQIRVRVLLFRARSRLMDLHRKQVHQP